MSIAQDRPMGAGEDLARAFTLPASAYLDESIFKKERDRIFGRTWQLVARADELARVGDLKPTTILDEPILIAHSLDGTLRGFYNVCRHRAAQVVLSKGNRRSLQARAEIALVRPRALQPEARKRRLPLPAARLRVPLLDLS